ncbi:MAG: 3-deoxy-7-phosphoheptulonate synthase [Elusimicrobia bacterium]|nr:3-deoxy-7-phosphoheptulonate synthase [Elusimicrobiota bacterium]
MFVVLRPGSGKADLRRVLRRAVGAGCRGRVLADAENPTVAVSGETSKLEPSGFQVLPGVREVLAVGRLAPQAPAGRRPAPAVVEVAGGKVRIGGDRFTVIAGPCVVESEKSLLRIARGVKKAGAHLLRGGAFKPRTSPYCFQGLGEAGLKALAAARAETGLPIVTEALDQRSLELVYEYADVIQIGARNMQNYALLKEAGRLAKPIMLKRGISATIDEWLMSAEYLLAEGNSRVILCERGIRTFSGHTRNTLDLNAVCVARGLSRLPVIVDPSHGTGVASAVVPMARAAAALPSHGIMVEVHDRPGEALCDGHQALRPAEFADLMRDLAAMSRVCGYRL